MTNLKLLIFSLLALLISCANVDSLIGVYHERIELKGSFKNINNNGLETLNHFLRENEKIDSIQKDYLLFFMFGYGCHFNERFLNRLDSLRIIRPNIQLVYCCDNLTTRKRTKRLVRTINISASESLIYPKNGVKRSLHKVGLNVGVPSSYENFPNNLYLMNKNGEIIYGSLLPMRKVIDTIKMMTN